MKGIIRSISLAAPTSAPGPSHLCDRQHPLELTLADTQSLRLSIMCQTADLWFMLCHPLLHIIRYRRCITWTVWLSLGCGHGSSATTLCFPQVHDMQCSLFPKRPEIPKSPNWKTANQEHLIK